MKEDPLQQTRRAPRALWLDRENNQQARDAWWEAFRALMYDSSAPFGASHMPAEGGDRRIWDIAWAASVAAHAYIWEGRLGPES